MMRLLKLCHLGSQITLRPLDIVWAWFHRSWLAYPHFSPPERFQPFKLTEGLYLNNAWENAASAMEMSAVAAKNCALLIARHLSRSQACSSQDPLVHDSSTTAESLAKA